jgi:autotransporter-associated beta strand protein
MTVKQKRDMRMRAWFPLAALALLAGGVSASADIVLTSPTTEWRPTSFGIRNAAGGAVDQQADQPASDIVGVAGQPGVAHWKFDGLVKPGSAEGQPDASSATTFLLVTGERADLAPSFVFPSTPYSLAAGSASAPDVTSGYSTVVLVAAGLQRVNMRLGGSETADVASAGILCLPTLQPSPSWGSFAGVGGGAGGGRSMATFSPEGSHSGIPAMPTVAGLTHDRGTIVIKAGGALSLADGGLTNTFRTLTNTGGTFYTGRNNTLIGTGASVYWSGGTNTIAAGSTVSDQHWVITGGTNTVNATGTLTVAAGATAPMGLYFGGTASPTITLESSAGTAGRILLNQDVTVDTTLTSGTAQILSGGTLANPGFIDLQGGTRTFTVNDGDAATDMLISTLIQNGSLTKAGAGTLVLSGANSYTGTTTVKDGTLTLDYTTVGSKLADTSVLALGGGTLNLANGASAHNEVVASTTINAGASSMNRTSGTSVLRMNAITRNVGGTIDFSAAGIADTDTSNTNGILGGWATVAGTNWASSATGAADTAITAYTAYQTSATIGNWATTDNISLTGNPSANLGNRTINSLRLTGTSTVTMTKNRTLTLSSGG